MKAIVSISFLHFTVDVADVQKTVDVLLKMQPVEYSYPEQGSGRDWFVKRRETPTVIFVDQVHDADPNAKPESVAD